MSISSSFAAETEGADPAPKASLPEDDVLTSYHTNTGREINGEYDISYILKNCNLSTTGDYKGQHVVGPVITGGYFKGYLGGTGTGSFHHQVSSCIRSSSFMDINYFDDELYFYTGKSSSASCWVTGADGKVREDALVRTDSFIDPSAMDRLAGQAGNIRKKSSIKVRSDIETDLEKDHYIYMKDCGDHIDKLRMEDGYRYDVTGIDMDVIDITGCSGSDADVIVFSDDETVNMPKVYFNGREADSEESGNETGLLFIAAEAGVFNGPSMGGHTGHIVAPLATVNVDAGDYNGCIIAASINSRGEGHMWPYSGTLIDDEDGPGTGALSMTRKVSGPDGEKDRAFRFQAAFTKEDGE